MKSPKLQLFNAVFSKSLSLGYTTVDYNSLNDTGLGYPFVHVSESISSDVIDNKQVITGLISQTVHVWGYAHDRALFADMVFSLEQELRRLSRLDNYYVRLTALDSNEIIDTSTDDTLLHGIIQAEYKLT